MKLGNYDDRNEESLTADLDLPLLLLATHDLEIDLTMVEMKDLLADLNLQIVSSSQKFNCEQLYPLTEVSYPEAVSYVK